ncbi:MAG: DUF2730 domain-containing protein [Magnetococcus sp. YQC-5]
MDAKTVLDYVPIVLTISNGLLAWAVWSIRQFTKEEVSEFRREAESRFAQIESRFEAGPKQEDIVKIADQMIKLHGAMERMTGQMEAQTHQVRLLIEHHMRRGGQES